MIAARFLAGMDRGQIAAVLAADPELDAVVGAFAALRRELDQFAHTYLVDGASLILDGGASH
jgi:hypothetical protein